MIMRKAGLLMPVASLPSNYGIGDFGKGCYEFIDFMKECGIGIWQILPLNPLGYGNSPYQPYSSYAGDELYIDLDTLYQEGLLKKRPQPLGKDNKRIDYERVRIYKGSQLKKAYKNFVKTEEYEMFIKEEWVYHYAVFLTLKKQNHFICWNLWLEDQRKWIKDKNFDVSIYQDEINYEMFIQYMFFKQWKQVKDYAGKMGIEIMGDIPFYVGLDSLDVWMNQEDFLLDEKGSPKFIAGVPPDYFSETGQRWGNPVYNWEHLKETGYKFWLDRIAYNAKLFDIIRIDHFRAFDTYWKIPASCETAIDGVWIEAPGYEFFDTLLKTYPDLRIVAEDLGDMRPEVYDLRDYYKFPGMKIIQFTFDPLEKNHSFKDRKNMIVYTGTHDNETMMGWLTSQPVEIQKAAEETLYKLGYESGDILWDFVQYTLDNIAETAILPVQDILGLGNEGRLNVPGTLGTPNWEWRLTSMDELRRKQGMLKKALEKSHRIKVS
ncbi:MAG TPA: 4-alpha-glucanotransferase [Candidatus Merdenecus merdavium]|nr:4-alpha-glucanotransferase [Candidatus Merdenecus merdavium]